MNTITVLVLASVLVACDISARGVDYSDYQFIKKAELVIQGAVIECRTNGTYKINVDRVLKGNYKAIIVDLPFRHFYLGSTETKALSLSKNDKAIFFLRYTRNGDDDATYNIQLKRIGGDTLTNRQRLPYLEGYEIIDGSLGVQKRATKKALADFGDALLKADEFLRNKKADTLTEIFTSLGSMRIFALDALYDNPELFRANRELFGGCLVQCLADSDLSVRNEAAWLIKEFDYREATAVLNSYTNTPNASFREVVLSTLKTFELRTTKPPKK